MPEKIVSKVGGVGHPIPLMVNYFSMVDKTSCSIKQYRVDFDPPEDNMRVRKKLLRAHQARLGQHYIFDGTMLFLERLLPEQVRRWSVLISTGLAIPPINFCSGSAQLHWSHSAWPNRKTSCDCRIPIAMLATGQAVFCLRFVVAKTLSSMAALFGVTLCCGSVFSRRWSC